MRRVHVDHEDGSPLYDRLYQREDSLVLLFESGHGFVDMLDVDRFHWKVLPGWRGQDEEPFLAREEN